MSFVRILLLFVTAQIVFKTVISAAIEEGRDCDLYGEPGVCKKLANCPSALVDIQRSKSPPPPTCSYDKKDNPVVCCKKDKAMPQSISKSTAQTTTEYIPAEEVFVNVDKRTGINECAPLPLNSTSPPTGQKAWDKCLEYQEKYVFPCEKSPALGVEKARFNRCHHNADDLIIGGTDAKEYEFPHMVLLGYKSDDGIIWQCGGSLISEKFVLTAGHCIIDVNQVNVSHALIGTLRVSDMAPRFLYEIKRIIKHDQYNSPSKYHDIALLELEREVKLSHRTTPACLHVGDPVDFTRASATGWGTTDENQQVNSDILQKVILTSFNTSECVESFPPHRNIRHGFLEDRQICFGDRTKSQDTCKGDSGGPLQIKSKKIACMYVVIGVTSFGNKCATAGSPAVYTKVSHYLTWIENIVWPDK